MVEPPQLLEDLGVRWVVCDDTFVGIFGSVVIFLLLVDVADLEPDVGVSEGAWRISENAIEAIKGFFVLSLLLVNDTETEQDLVGLVKVQAENLIHTQDR